jgi:signal transduction histidine kinase
MRLSLKLTAALTCAILLVLGLNAVIRVKRELALFASDSQRDSMLLGRAIAGAAARVWNRVGETEAKDVVEDANEREAHISIRWVRLDAPPGDPEAPAIPATRLGGIESSGASAGHEVGDSTVTYVALAGPGDKRVALELRESLSPEHDYMRKSLLQATITTSTLVVLCGLLTLGLGAVFVGRPVRQLVEQARRIGRGDLSNRLALRQRDEIGELAREMNAMSEQLSAARSDLDAETQAKLAAVDQLRHADRLATVGKLAAGIAHEVGTPLNVITGYAQLVADECPAPHPASENAQTILQQANRVAEIIRQLLDFARPRTPSKEPHELTGLANQAVGVLETLARKRGVKLEVTSAGAVHASVDGGQLQQVVTNLVVNAIHASPPDRTVNLEIGRTRATPPPEVEGSTGEYAILRVRDEGAGIAREHRARIFEPFFTTKDVGEGTGLGLAVVYGIVKEHGGWIALDSEPGAGTSFTVYLPLENPR